VLPIQEFLSSVTATYKTGTATEHSYRPALQKLLNSLDSKVTALNEPKRVDVGAPDFAISRGEIVIGHCEAKDIPVDLKSLKDANKAQKERYIGGLSNLLYTNCLEWVWYRDGEKKAEVRIAELSPGIQSNPENYAALENLLREFIAQTPQSITSSRALAVRMAGKAALIKDVLANALLQDQDHATELYGQYETFKDLLIHDITIADFADMYAETITYGMFAARLHDTTLENFSRQEALELLPKSNPFLRNLFSYIAGPTLDERIVWIIDDLAKVFQASDVFTLMEGYKKSTQQNDPFLHFYEDFLKAYNPAKREARGVWYTPEPVVDFIVRAVDEVLKNEFGLPDGLADTSKVKIDWDTGQRGLTKKGELTKSTATVKETREVHRVQILDPAVGTGTFLAQAIKHIAPRVRASAPGMWNSYVEKDLIPRLHGFELLMASYAMCHMKLEMVLREHGYKPTSTPPRVSVYLTNSLEEGEAANQSLPFAQWLSNEVKAANSVKRDMPIMCIIGNPPYSGESSNKGDWIMRLMDAYKMEPGGVEKLKERNSKWINDDYAKFIRMAESMIERNGEGVLGFITNHGYLDNPTFRGMRWHLLKTFDKIYVLDLHGNSKKREVSPDGSPDKNVFDIQQGVAIIIAVKKTPTIRDEKRKKSDDIPLAEVFHSELWGDRKNKYESLWRTSLRQVQWEIVPAKAPHFPFENRDWNVDSVYQQGFPVDQLFGVGGTGIVTKRDELTIHDSPAACWQAVNDMLSRDESYVRSKYNIPADVRDWKYEWALQDLRSNFNQSNVKPMLYRPFTERFIYYTGNARGFVGWPVEQVMRHLNMPNNFALLTPKITADDYGAWVSSVPVSNKAASRYDQTYCFPLYLHPAEDELDQARRVNFEPKLYAKLRKFAKHPSRGEPDEVAIFDYIYGVLHCPAYRETYAEFLKIDFPRIPWPARPDVFWDVSDGGRELRRLHLMEPAAVGPAHFPFKGSGSNTVEKVEFKDGTVWINESQRFENVPEVSWGFYIGGYQPAQKWLKDRKGRALDYADVQHYQRILKILSETDRIMKTIEMPFAAETSDL
jgi:predicted helicase